MWSNQAGKENPISFDLDEMVRPKTAYVIRERDEAGITNQRPSKAPGAFEWRQPRPGKTYLDAC